MADALTQSSGRAVSLGNLRPFAPGQRGNPGGQPKGLARRVRQETKDGAELVAFMLRVLRGRKQPTRYRLEAAAWLADRGFGKALQQMELSGPGAEPLTIRIEYAEEAADADADGPPSSTASGAQRRCCMTGRGSMCSAAGSEVGEDDAGHRPPGAARPPRATPWPGAPPATACSPRSGGTCAGPPVR